MLTDKQRELVAIFMNGGSGSNKIHAQQAARAHLHEGTATASDVAIAQLRAQAEWYAIGAFADTKDKEGNAASASHKSNHNAMAEALLALVDEFSPAKSESKGSKKG